MGARWSHLGWPAAAAGRDGVVYLAERDVLMLCEDGDLLLLREQIANRHIRVAMDVAVAQDVERMQHGVFPNERVTTLPAWTSCGVLVRYNGILHVLGVNTKEMRMTPFTDRVTKTSSRHDRFAVRRLQHVRSEISSEFFRQLVMEVTTVLPCDWHSMQHFDNETNRNKVLPPLVNALLHRMIQLFLHSIARAEVSDSHANTERPTHSSSPSSQDRSTQDYAIKAKQWTSDQDVHNNSSPQRALSRLEHKLDRLDAHAYLSAAFVGAVYEHIHILPPIALTSPSPATTVPPLTPSAFYTRSSDHERLSFTPENALGQEMLIRVTQQSEY